MLEIKTVHQCNCRLGGKRLCPQACIIRLDGDRTPESETEKVRFGFYTILLIEHENGEKACCGCGKYDFSDATMVFLPPERPFCMDGGRPFPGKGWLVAFQKDLFSSAGAYAELEKYSFFGYNREEALHLSIREKDKIIECINLMDEELHHPADCHSATLLVRCIGLILDYCTRYYERQFITREDRDDSLVKKTDAFLDEFVSSGKLERRIYPTPALCAAELGLSEEYFSDMLKFHTGKTLREYFDLKLIALSKKMLLERNASPEHVAKHLGFRNIDCFNLVFKKITGVAPGEYLLSRN